MYINFLKKDKMKKQPKDIWLQHVLLSVIKSNYISVNLSVKYNCHTENDRQVLDILTFIVKSAAPLAQNK